MFSRLRETGDELWRDGRGWVLSVISVGWLLGFGIRVSFPVLLPNVRDAFALSLTRAGVLLTVLWLAYAVGHVPGGYVGDRVGERLTLACGMAVTATGLAVATVAPAAWTLFLGTAVMGFGVGVFSPTRFTVLSDIYSAREGTAIAISTAAGNVGNAVLPVAAGLLTGALGWRAGMGYPIPLLLGTAVGIWVAVPAHTSARATQRFSLGAVRRILASVGGRSTLLAAGTFMLMSFVYQGFTGFYPTFLEMEGLSQETVAVVYGLFFAAGVVVQPLAGAGADAIGLERAMRIVVGVPIAGMAAVPLVQGTLAFAVVTLVLSVQLGFYPLVSSYLIATLPEETQSSGLGVLRLLIFTGAATGPIVVGALADRDLFGIGLFLLAGLLAVAWAATLLLPPVER